MGADIHGVLQERYSSHSKTWYTTALIDNARNYVLFAALAGVRNYWDVKPISEPRGLPDSFDEEKAEKLADAISAYWGDHSHSWLSIKELVNWEGWDQIIEDEKGLKSTIRDHCGQFLAWLKWAEMSTSWGHEARIVFCFDS